jgi:hypothetical protein
VGETRVSRHIVVYDREFGFTTNSNEVVVDRDGVSYPVKRIVPACAIPFTIPEQCINGWIEIVAILEAVTIKQVSPLPRQSGPTHCNKDCNDQAGGPAEKCGGERF